MPGVPPSRQGAITTSDSTQIVTMEVKRLQTPWLSALFLRYCGDRVGNAWRLGAGDPLISTRWLLGLTSSALLLPCLAFSWIYRVRFHTNFIGYIIIMVENGMAESWQCLDPKARAYTWRHTQPVLRSCQSTVVETGNGVRSIKW
jgi:hypothetical protein